MINRSAWSLPRRARLYWHAVLIAASVSFGQLGSGAGRNAPPPYAIVQLLPESGDRFSRKEQIGGEILTRSLQVTDVEPGARISEFLN